MLEIPVEMLRSEIIRLRAVVANTRIFHPSGMKLHSPAAALVFHRVKGSVRDHMTTFRGIRPSSVLRSPQTRPF